MCRPMHFTKENNDERNDDTDHGPEDCESQQEDVVTVNVPEGHAQPQVTVNVTALDEVHERIREPQVAKLWTAEELEEISLRASGDEKTFSVAEAVSHSGFGKFQWYLLIVCGTFI